MVKADLLESKPTIIDVDCAALERKSVLKMIRKTVGADNKVEVQVSRSPASSRNEERCTISVLLPEVAHDSLQAGVLSCQIKRALAPINALCGRHLTEDKTSLVVDVRGPAGIAALADCAGITLEVQILSSKKALITTNACQATWEERLTAAFRQDPISHVAAIKERRTSEQEKGSIFAKVLSIPAEAAWRRAKGKDGSGTDKKEEDPLASTITITGTRTLSAKGEANLWASISTVAGTSFSKGEAQGSYYIRSGASEGTSRFKVQCRDPKEVRGLIRLHETTFWYNGTVYCMEFNSTAFVLNEVQG